MMINTIRMTIMKIKNLITLSSMTAWVGQISSVVPEQKISSLVFIGSQTESQNMRGSNIFATFFINSYCNMC